MYKYLIADIIRKQHNIYPPTAIEKTYYRAVVTSLPQCGYVVTALR